MENVLAGTARYARMLSFLPRKAEMSTFKIIGSVQTDRTSTSVGQVPI
jgi:hypothetical protein